MKKDEMFRLVLLALFIFEMMKFFARIVAMALLALFKLV
jgi:hypothetical protein